MCPDAMRRFAYRPFWETDPTCIEIRSNFALLERAVAQFDTRFTLRALRSISSLRKRLTDRVLCTVIVVTYSAKNPTARLLIQAVGMEGEDLKAVADQHKDAVQALKNSTKEPLPEVDVYIGILLQVCKAVDYLYLVPPFSGQSAEILAILTAPTPFRRRCFPENFVLTGSGISIRSTRLRGGRRILDTTSGQDSGTQSKDA